MCPGGNRVVSREAVLPVNFGSLSFVVCCVDFKLCNSDKLTALNRFIFPKIAKVVLQEESKISFLFNETISALLDESRMISPKAINLKGERQFSQ